MDADGTLTLGAESTLNVGSGNVGTVLIGYQSGHFGSYNRVREVVGLLDGMQGMVNTLRDLFAQC